MRTFTIFLVALSITISTSAQDLLVKRNGEQMRVKVLKITKKKVEFVRFGSELPIYTLPVSDIDYIEYPMGDRDTFNMSQPQPSTVEKTESAPTPTPAETVERWHGAVPSPNPNAPATIKIAESEEQTYTIGEIYEKDGVKGVVALLYDGGKHGVIMSLDEACLEWCSIHRKKTKLTGANNRTDGVANMLAIEQFIAKNNLSWSDFPAFEWCRNKGEGWYLPSLNELWSAGTMYMGGTRTDSKRKLRKTYNSNIEMAGGTPISDIMIYHSSTEEDAKYSYYSHMNSEPPYTNSGYKADKLFVRAFHKF